jgi:hypothetical protein
VTAIELRYEWRVWGERLDDVAARMEGASPRLDTRDSDETYFVPTNRGDVNPKVRDGQLDVKVLRNVRDGFEQWEPRIKAPLPVPVTLVAYGLFALLDIDPPDFSREAYSLDQLLAEVVGPHPALIAIEVSKRRHAYVVQGCTAEFAEVDVAGRAMQTAAVESTDLVTLRRAWRDVGLDEYDNINYPTAIARALSTGT